MTCLRRLVEQISQDGGGWRGQQLRPIDPLTLADLPGHTPIRLGARFSSALSPDGNTLAVLATTATASFPPPGGGIESTLQLIDLAGWRDLPTPVTVAGEIAWLGFAPEGRTLSWLVSADDPATAPTQREYTLYRYVPGAARVELVSWLPRGAVGEEFRPSCSGHQLILYNRALDANGQPTDTPQLQFLNLASGRFVATLQLAGVRAVSAGEPGRKAEILVPGLAWDIAHDRLYVAHTDAELITVVDLGARTIVRQADIVGESPPPSYDLPTYSTETALQMGHARYRFLSVDATGKRLILSGREMITTPLPGGRWQAHDRIETPRSLDAITFSARATLPAHSNVLAATERGC
ncbi:MAG: hypothetical protein AVDCRST_MAG18-2143 [uncultured Thermomicrobiales bacterium]|uniref:Uncharacterized protein n=1 Tax=uncultured Thermomicrobiales bacterium TaxID=1645740 RepID=A0A6J4V947_9BACT|nr:MAG: hypothetical protein AVDCRST_MAG18-2143 [uncultured Thermomicrobiales bacterium]